jgi:hypothetical protein
MLLISNSYSILYYFSEIWLLHTMTHISKKKLMRTLSGALRLAYNYKYQFMSNYELHKMARRATPKMLTNYRLTLFDI